MKNRKYRLKQWLIRMTAAMLSGVGLICIFVRISGKELRPVLEMAAAEMTMPTGSAVYAGYERAEKESSPVLSSAVQSTEEQKNSKSSTSKKTEDASHQPSESVSSPAAKTDDATFQAHTPTAEELKAYDREHEGEEQYPVHEFSVTEGNCSYGQVQVKNTASTDIDIQQELKAELGFAIEKTDEPQVLIYHTHTSESYLTYDTGYFYESFFPRSTEQSENVCAVGKEIARQLNAAGIRTIHDTTLHDYPSYRGAYDRSLATIEEYLKKYPSIKVVLDIHRDGIGTDTEKYKPVFTAEGRQGAQMMILAGYNYDGCEEFEDWEYNLRFALRIQEKAAAMYPGMARPVNFSDFMYNMNVNTGSLLIEIGGESNTLEEARYTGYLLGKVLCQVLKPENFPSKQ